MNLHMHCGTQTLLAACVLAVAGIALAKDAPQTQPALPDPIVLNVYPGDGAPPNLAQNAKPEYVTNGRIFSVSIPTMSVYLPDKADANGAAMIWCPGGGYAHLAGMDELPKAFVPKGFAVITLKYRTHMPSADPVSDALADAKRTMRTIRLHADEWHIDPTKVGIAGVSAGANVSLNLTTHGDRGDPAASDPIDRQSCRPDFALLISFWPYRYSSKMFPIDKTTPPIFLAHAEDDRIAKIDQAKDVAARLKAADVPVDMEIYPTGGHGCRGDDWQSKFLPWLKEAKIVK